MGKCKQGMLPGVVNLDSWTGIMERLCGNLLKLFAIFCEWIHLVYFLLSSGLHLLAAAPVNLVCAKPAATRSPKLMAHHVSRVERGSGQR